MSIDESKPTENVTGRAWRTSSYSSGHGGACVEVSTGHDLTLVRDSKDRSGAVLTFPTTAWNSFVHATSTGEISPS